MMSKDNKSVDVTTTVSLASSLGSPLQSLHTPVFAAQSHEQHNLRDALADATYQRSQSNDRLQNNEIKLEPMSSKRLSPNLPRIWFSSPPPHHDIVLENKPLGCLGLGITSLPATTGKVNVTDTGNLSLSIHTAPSPHPLRDSTSSQPGRGSSRDSPSRSAMRDVSLRNRDMSRRPVSFVEDEEWFPTPEKKLKRRRDRKELSVEESKKNPKKKLKTVEPPATPITRNDEAHSAESINITQLSGSTFTTNVNRSENIGIKEDEMLVDSKVARDEFWSHVDTKYPLRSRFLLANCHGWYWIPIVWLPIPTRQISPTGTSIQIGQRKAIRGVKMCLNVMYSCKTSKFWLSSNLPHHPRIFMYQEIIG